MLLENVLDPVARYIAQFLAETGAEVGSPWAGYRSDEGLLSLKREADDLVGYFRPANHEGRLHLFNIRSVDPDPSTIVFHSPIVLSSEPKASSEIEINNLDHRVPQTYTFRKEFKTGEAEESAVVAGFSATSKSKVEAGGEASQWKASQEFSATVSSEWTNQTGRSSEDVTGGEFPLVAPPHSLVKGFLGWNDETLQRRIECDGLYDFGIAIGRRRRRKGKWDWTSGSPVVWDSLEHLIAVAEKRGSVHHARYEHFANMELDPLAKHLLIGVKNTRLQKIDRLTPPFKGATGIRVVVTDIENRDDD